MFSIETKDFVKMYARLNGEYVLQTTRSGLVKIEPEHLLNASLLSKTSVYPLSLQTLGNGDYRIDI